MNDTVEGFNFWMKINDLSEAKRVVEELAKKGEPNITELRLRLMSHLIDADRIEEVIIFYLEEDIPDALIDLFCKKHIYTKARLFEEKKYGNFEKTLKIAKEDGQLLLSELEEKEDKFKALVSSLQNERLSLAEVLREECYPKNKKKVKTVIPKQVICTDKLVEDQSKERRIDFPDGFYIIEKYLMYEIEEVKIPKERIIPSEEIEPEQENRTSSILTSIGEFIKSIYKLIEDVAEKKIAVEEIYYFPADDPVLYMVAYELKKKYSDFWNRILSEARSIWPKHLDTCEDAFYAKAVRMGFTPLEMKYSRKPLVRVDPIC